MSGCLTVILWILLIAFFIFIGIVMCSPILFLFGMGLLFIPLIIGEIKASTTVRGKLQRRRRYKKQRKIEKEFGIIEYWEK